MVAFRKKEGRSVPAISTASMPDVIFMLLFFFMISTSMRYHNTLVSARPPAASQAGRLGNVASASYISIGAPGVGIELRMQLGGRLGKVSDIPAFIALERERLGSANEDKLSVVLKADRDVPMATIEEVKQELRNAGALDVTYVVERKSEGGTNLNPAR